MNPRLAPRSLALGIFGTAALAAMIFGTADERRLAKADGPAQPATAIDFNRHIRPILAENCFACHGPDEKTRKAKFRLDTREGAFAALRDGDHALVAGKPDQSVLIDRLTGGPNRIMPPPKFNKKLTVEQIALLKRWVAEGANWSDHWAYVTPKKPELPQVGDAGWVRNEVDRFILARLTQKGLKPSAEADKTTLIRRVTFDLTGLPPTPAEVDAFLADNSPEAYEKVVDRLLKSPRYGEHMTRFWLDVARYGDTHGMHLDNYREIWPYRDWLLKAFNQNKPYDQFVIEQLAGDMMPNATLDQRIASGFNRCHITTGEGGSIAEEIYVRNVIDRVETTGIVFLGMTVGCARCHDHKYDPVTQKDFFSMFAFFNSLDQNPLDGNAAAYPPVVKVASPEQLAKLDALQKQVEGVRKQIAEAVAKVQYDESADKDQPEQAKPADYVWIDDALPAGAKAATPWTFVGKPDPVHSGEKSLKLEVAGLGQHYFEGANPGIKIGEGDTLFAHVYIDPAKLPKEIMLQWHSDGWKHRAYWGENVIPWGADNSTERFKMGALPKAGEWVRLEVPAAKVGLKAGTVVNGWAFTAHDGVSFWDKAGLVTRTPQGTQRFETLSAWLQAQHSLKYAGLPKPVADIAKLAPAKRNDAQKKQLRDYFIEHAYARTRDTFDPLHKQLTAAEKDRDQLDKQIPTSLVSSELPQPKPAHILKRGEYDQKGEVVGRQTPGFLPPMPADAPKDRLGFARWLVSREHPLTARVAVNRFWQQCFGTGIVKTSEDFGSQGEPPSHSELLDWLSVQFMDDGWDVKKTMKRMVMSATYRQSSKVTKDRLAADPANRLLARGPRFRLDAEMLRDQALSISGLLVEKVGGPSVKPPQPAGLWEAVGFVGSNTARFTPDTGHDKVHRRSMYTFWKRTSSPPQMNAFDAPSREACVVRRERTNTPLQALLLLNETQYIECARALAERAMKEAGDKPEDRLAFMFRLAAARKPDAIEATILTETLNEHLAKYKGNVEAARKLIAVGETKADPKLNPSELAAWTMIANLILNLDEVLNKG